jgi:hypothetical protein
VHRLTQTAEWLRGWLSQQAWLEPARPLIERAPDWLLLSTGPILLALLVLAARALLQPRRAKRQSRPDYETGSATTPMGAPQGARTRVFLSYSRKDADFTGRLANALSAKGYVVDIERSKSHPEKVQLGK